MLNEKTKGPKPAPPHCPNCAQTMRLSRKTRRFNGLPDLYIFKCQKCDMSHTAEGTIGLVQRPLARAASTCPLLSIFCERSRRIECLLEGDHGFSYVGSPIGRICIMATAVMRRLNPLLRNRARRLAELRTALGEPLPANAHAKIKRLLARLELVLTQIAELERGDAVVQTEASDRASKMIQQLTALRSAFRARPCGPRSVRASLCQWQGTRIIRRFGFLAIVGSAASRASERPAIGGSER
jgi:hypothetical protein